MPTAPSPAPFAPLPRHTFAWAPLAWGLLSLGCAAAQAAQGQAPHPSLAGWQPAPGLSMTLATDPRRAPPPPSGATPHQGADAAATAPRRWPQLLAWASDQAATNRAAMAKADAAQALDDQAHATAWMPRVDASASATRTRQSSQGQRVSGPATSLNLSATQPLWRAADRATSRAQSAQARSAVWQAETTRLETARQVSLAYVQAAQVAEQKRLLQAQQALLEQQLHINERRMQAGAGTILDLLETRTRLDQTRASVQDADTQLQSLAWQIHKLCGLRLPLPRGLSDDTQPVPEVVPGLSDALQLAPTRNPSWRDALAQREAAAATLAARDAERWQPTVDATATWSQQSQRDPLQDDGTLRTRSTAVGVQLNFPLFSGGLQGGRTREALARQAEADAQLDAVATAVTAQLQDDYQTLVQAHKAWQVQQEVAASATATFEAVRKAFVAGMRTNLDLLNAQQQIQAARQDLVAARVQAVSAQVDILAALDQLDAPHIAALAPLVDDNP